jgi:hypothetical protein
MAYIRSNPWADAAEAGQGLGQTLTQLLFALPQLRQQQALLAAHQQLYGAQSGLYGAEAERARAQTQLYGAETERSRAQTGEITSAEQARSRLGDALWSISMAKAGGLDIAPHVSRAVDAMARLPDKDRSDLAKNLAQMLEMESPRFRQALGTGQHAILPVASQGALYDVVSGEPRFQMPQHLPSWSSLVDTTSGRTIGLGPQRPTPPEHLGSVYGAFARTFAENNYDDPEALTKFLGLMGSRQTNFAQPMLTPGGTNTVPRIRRYNPATDGLE